MDAKKCREKAFETRVDLIRCIEKNIDQAAKEGKLQLSVDRLDSTISAYLSDHGFRIAATGNNNKSLISW